jgi:two-component system chemotaxis response regulator CheY
MASPRILSVGQCGYDHGRLARFAQQAVGAELVGADTAASALEALRQESFDLVLVNRVGDRDGRPGLDLIRSLKADPATASVPVMLVSNYPDAQDAAEAAGALRGFGKAEVGQPEVADRMKAALGESVGG